MLRECKECQHALWSIWAGPEDSPTLYWFCGNRDCHFHTHAHP